MAEKADEELDLPLFFLERQLIKAYVSGAGYDFHTLVNRNDEEARRLLAAASRDASAKLSEIEARMHYVRCLHGDRRRLVSGPGSPSRIEAPSAVLLRARLRRDMSGGRENRPGSHQRRLE